MATKVASANPAIMRVIERQMRNWEIARNQKVGQPGPPAREVEDFITISRAVGAGGQVGDQVAGMLAARLGWPVFDKEILDAMSGDDHIRRQIYESMDERDIGWFEETLRSVVQPELKRNDYFHRLTETILGLARKGKSVFQGRAADLILPRGRGLRVRLTAPLECRIACYADRNAMTPQEAATEITRIDRERTEFVERYFRSRLDTEARCDLVLNVGRLTAEQAVEIIFAAVCYFGIQA